MMSVTKSSALDERRFYSAAYVNFQDTSPGGSFAMNAPAQYTRFADIRDTTQVFQGKDDPTGWRGRGMGRYYFEAINQNSQEINMRFGQPRFNSMSTFFTGFYNASAGAMARTGRATGMFYNLGRAVGFVVPLFSWRLLAVSSIANGLRFMMEKPQTKYYYSKPNMPLYWTTVQQLVNRISVNRGIIPRVGGADQQSLNGNSAYTIDSPAGQDALGKLNSLLPEIFRKGGGVDVYAMATRTQRMAEAQRQRLKAASDGESTETITQRVSKVLGKGIEGLQGVTEDYFQYMDLWLSTEVSKPKEPGGTDDVNTETISYVDKDSIKQTRLDEWGKFLEAELNQGSAFACLRVNYTGAVGESFSSQTGESDIATKINSMSADSRRTNFDFAGGNLGSGALAQMLGGAVNAVKDFAAGVGDSVGLSGLAALGGAAFVDIPKKWESSSARLPQASYTIELRSPYGNPISQLVNIYVPLCMLLAGALPLSTGAQSYTSPFLVELYDQGRCQTRLGMIDSLQITRGTGNLGFNKEGNALAIDVSFTVQDLSSILHIPVSEGFSFGKLAKGLVGAGVTAAGASALGGIPTAVLGGTAGAAAAASGGAGATGTLAGGVAGAASGAFGAGVLGAAVGWASATGLFGDDTAYSDYMAVLAGQGLYDQIYQWPKLKLRLTEQMVAADQMFSKSRISMFLADTLPGQVVGAFYRGTER